MDKVCWFCAILGPCLERDIVGEEECSQEWVMFVRVGMNGDGGGNEVDDDGGVFEGVDADCVPCACICCSCLDVIRETESLPRIDMMRCMRLRRCFDMKCGRQRE